MKMSAFAVAAASVVFLNILISAMTAYPIMLLWNACLVNTISGVSAISYLQTWGLMVMLQLIVHVSAGAKVSLS